MLDAIRPWGASSLWARSFQLTPGWIDPAVSGAYRPDTHACIRPDTWWGSTAQVYADSRCPLARGAAVFQRPFMCTDIAGHDDRAYAEYWSAMGEFGVGDTLAIPHFGLNGWASALTIWFERPDFESEETAAIKLAGMMLLDQVRKPAAAAKPDARTRLSPRERDCLSFVADGKSDWEIGTILGISQATAHRHVENAKRRLGCGTRAQAVARAFTSGQLNL